ncbi:MAG: hypothetical protein JWO02_3612 [Solirubrobacterales bacterium]|nr:hypothetical protein [Solirubrobacterales bacterium]
MAQTKRKRKTKHRGNAAGMIETRGRTGRPLTPAEKTADAKAKARVARVDRLNSPPTWRGAINRAAIATVIFVVALLSPLFKQAIGPTLGLAGFIFLLYIPLGYYTDLYLYRWRQKRKAAGTGGDKTDSKR